MHTLKAHLRHTFHFLENDRLLNGLGINHPTWHASCNLTNFVRCESPFGTLFREDTIRSSRRFEFTSRTCIILLTQVVPPFTRVRPIWISNSKSGNVDSFQLVPSCWNRYTLLISFCFLYEFMIFQVEMRMRRRRAATGLFGTRRNRNSPSDYGLKVAMTCYRDES